MARRVTQWEPDTCRCKVAFVWEGDPPELVDTQIVAACPRHLNRPGADVHDENKRKNAAWNAARQAVPEAVRSLVRWAMTEDGNVEIEVPTNPPPGLSKDLGAFGARLRVRPPQ